MKPSLHTKQEKPMEYKEGTEVVIHGRKAVIVGETDGILELNFGGQYRDLPVRALESYQQLDMFPTGIIFTGNDGQTIRITSVLPNEQYTINVTLEDRHYKASVNAEALMINWLGSDEKPHQPTTEEIISIVEDPALSATASRINELQQRLDEMVKERDTLNATIQRLEESQTKLQERFETRGATIERMELEAEALRKQVADATTRAQKAEAMSATPAPLTDEFIIERDAEALRLSRLKAEGYRFIHFEFVPLNGRLMLCVVAQRSQQSGIVARRLAEKAQTPDAIMSPREADHIIFSERPSAAFSPEAMLKRVDQDPLTQLLAREMFGMGITDSDLSDAKAYVDGKVSQL